MVSEGDDGLILDDTHALGKSAESNGDNAVVYSDGLGRGRSDVSSGSEVHLVSPSLAQGSAEPGIIYFCDFTNRQSDDSDPSNWGGGYELQKRGFEILNQFSLDFDPHGMGGDRRTVWVGDDADKTAVYKLDPQDNFSVVSSGTLPAEHTEMGGSTDVLYTALAGSDEVARHDPSDYSIETIVSSPGTNVGGVGGDNGICWYTDTESVFELDPVTLEVIRSKDVSSQLVDSSRGIVGIGGSESSCFIIEQQDEDLAVGAIHEIDTDSLDIIRTKDLDFGTGRPSGIGGY